MAVDSLIEGCDDSGISFDPEKIVALIKKVIEARDKQTGNEISKLYKLFTDQASLLDEPISRRMFLAKRKGLIDLSAILDSLPMPEVEL